MAIQFSKEELLLSIKQIDNNPNLRNGRQSSTYDLVFENKKYPPILVLSVANKLRGGKELTLLDFGNNVEIPFKILRDNGFEVKSKIIKNTLNNKEQFKTWILNNLTENSGAGPAYITSIEWLSNRFFEKGKITQKSIFDIEDIDLITDLHTEVKEIQRDTSSFIYNKDAPSYGNKYFYSASLGKYKEFLLSKNDHNFRLDQLMKSKTKQENFSILKFQSSVYESGLIFSPQLIQRFVASLCTKPFVICTGLSGSGKTKLSQAFTQWITADKSQYEIVSVGADWTNREPLLGYPNALSNEEYVSPENGVLDLMIRAKLNIENTEEPTKPYFLILDEMNLSHVERYFADFLSTMESGDEIPLHKIVEEIKDIPQKTKLPKNLFIIGTVNIDETTYMFSPKVLDRANTIEFRLTEENLQEFIDSDIKLNMDVLKAQGANMSESFMAMALKETDKNLKDNADDLKLFFSELKKSGAEFGYRTASEIGRLIYMLEELGEEGDNLLDIAIMQKLLPKLHGSRNKLTKVLPVLGGFCLKDNSKIKIDYLDKFVSNSITEAEIKFDVNIKYKISFEKICRMYKNAVENGFASYAEA